MSALRQILVLMVLAGLAGGAWLWVTDQGGTAASNHGFGQHPIPVRHAVVEEGLVREIVEAVATTRAREAVAIVPLVSGRLEAVHFAPGERVEAGQVLATLESTMERTVVDEARARLEDARSQYERAQQLVRTRNIAESRVDELRAAFAGARARLEGVEKQFADRTILAPFAGVVGLREVSVGARVDNDTVLTTLDQLDTLEVEFSVPERYYGQIRPGTEIVAASNAYADERFVGQVDAIDSRIDPVSRSFRVRAAIDNEDLRLPAGLFMTVDIVIAERAALLIPEEAVLSQGRSSFVFRLDDGVTRRVEVRLGYRRLGEVEVVEGLGAGERIAVTGLQRLRDGSMITLQEAPAAAPSS
jgi:membrane fusion protein, multidrug efflux system